MKRRCRLASVGMRPFARGYRGKFAFVALFAAAFWIIFAPPSSLALFAYMLNEGSGALKQDFLNQ